MDASRVKGLLATIATEALMGARSIDRGDSASLVEGLDMIEAQILSIRAELKSQQLPVLRC